MLKLYSGIQLLLCYGRIYWLADGYYEKLIQDEDAKKFIESRLPSVDQYWSVIAELQMWGYLEARGLSPKLVQEDGLPDLEFSGENASERFYFDVKSLEEGSDLNAINRHIKKANRQIRNVSDSAKGGCFLRILGTHLGNNEGEFKPKRIAEVCSVVERIMNSNDNKCVATVVVIWEEVQCIGNVPGWQTWCVTRKSESYLHKKENRGQTTISAIYRRKKSPHHCELFEYWWWSIALRQTLIPQE